MTASAVVFAYHDVGARCLSVLLQRGLDIALVVTHRDDPGENTWFESVERLARESGLPVEMPDDPNAPAFLARLRAIAPDFIFSFYYRRMLSSAVLATARRGAFNMHGSLLPKYRGRAPVNWAVLRGERETGATLHEMVDKPDAGRIVDQEAVPIGENDKAHAVMSGITHAAQRVLLRSLPRLLDGTAQLARQDLTLGSYFGGRRPEDGRIDWTKPAWEVHNLIRAVAPPYPGAFTTWDAKVLRILGSWWDAPSAELPTAGVPGDIATLEGRKAYVRCGDGRWLDIREAQFPDEGSPRSGRDLVTRFAGGPSRVGESAPC